MFRKIVFYPNKELRKKSAPIGEITAEIKQLCLDITQTMIASDGIGLAAPQIGESKRIIVIQTEGGPKICINPEILEKTKEKEIGEEGCLSLPEIYANVKRSKGIRVKFLDENGRECEVKVKGMPARIFQHEIDHLDGVLFLDRAGFLGKWKARKRLQKLRQNAY